MISMDYFAVLEGSVITKRSPSILDVLNNTPFGRLKLHKLFYLTWIFYFISSFWQSRPVYNHTWYYALRKNYVSKRVPANLPDWVLRSIEIKPDAILTQIGSIACWAEVLVGEHVFYGSDLFQLHGISRWLDFKENKEKLRCSSQELVDEIEM